MQVCKLIVGNVTKNQLSVCHSVWMDRSLGWLKRASRMVEHRVISPCRKP
jgi:hypothetical protein